MTKKAVRIKDTEKKRSKIAVRLKAKANNPKDATLRELIVSLKSEIEEALEAGYDYDEVAEAFQVEGVDVKAATIRSYLPSKTKRKNTSISTDNSDASNGDTNDTANSETVTKSKRTKKSKPADSSDHNQIFASHTQPTSDINVEPPPTAGVGTQDNSELDAASKEGEMQPIGEFKKQDNTADQYISRQLDTANSNGNNKST